MEQVTVDSSVEKMCRLCLRNGETMIDVFLFSSKMNRKIACIIMKCAPVQISKHDRLPSIICDSCFNELERFYQFQIRAVESERTLRHLLQKDFCDVRNTDIETQTKILSEEVSVMKTTVNLETVWLNKSTKYENYVSVNQVKVKEEPLDENGTLNSGEETKYFDELKYSPEKSECNSDAKVSEKIRKKTARKNRKLKEPKQYVCGVCNKYFSQMCNLRKHKVLHTGEKPYQCDVCNKRFTQMCNLQKHKRLHTGEKPFLCDICSNSFTQLISLKTHRLLHTEDKTYKCDVCNKCFAHLNYLNKHKITHSGEKPHKCDVCNKCFNRSHHLKRHRVVHTGEKPYQCEVCNKCFTDPTTCRRHKLVHVDERPYQCNVCSKRFSKVIYLKKHKIQHLNNTI